MFVLQVSTLCLCSIIECVRVASIDTVFMFVHRTCSGCMYRHRVYVRSYNMFELQVSTLCVCVRSYNVFGLQVSTPCLCSFIECVRVASIDTVFMFVHRMCSCCKYRHRVYVRS